MDKIIVENLSITYSDGVESLFDINLRIPIHQITALIGPSGGGKSTFLRALNRLNDLADVAAITGKVLIDGIDVLDPALDVIALRRKVGIVFSRPLPLPLSIYQNVSYGLELMGEKRKTVLDHAVERALRLSDLWEEVKNRLNDPAYSISGGQQQRLCLARTLALQPEIILLDEPTSALDPVSTAKIESSLIELKKDYTVIIAPHNTQQAGRIADYVAFFLQGKLIEFSSADEIFTRPKDEKTQDYISGKFG
ncbi:MAG: phosphate ABC transporter ATP-binding protein [Anaerolineaceae bacterium]|jgi:phosphate transport system ATP-binding protein|nr:phosphate ABC transporter ATP-binding protein [Anaerolineaceae bacterium]